MAGGRRSVLRPGPARVALGFLWRGQSWRSGKVVAIAGFWFLALWCVQGGAPERDPSGIAVLLPRDPSGVAARLESAIGDSGRFHLLSAKGISIRASLPLLEPVPPVTLAERNRWLFMTQAHWIIFGTIGQHAVTVDDPSSGNPIASTSYDVALRVFDLTLGDTGPLFTASDPDPGAIAQQAVRFLRSQYPLHATVTAYADDVVYLDVGTQDGVTQGETFSIERHPGPYAQAIGTVQVTNAGDWFSQCEVEDQVKGRNPQAGDIAIEETASFLQPQD